MQSSERYFRVAGICYDINPLKARIIQTYSHYITIVFTFCGGGLNNDRLWMLCVFPEGREVVLSSAIKCRPTRRHIFSRGTREYRETLP